MFVTLWSPAPIGAAPAGAPNDPAAPAPLLAPLLARLLALAPHAAAEPRGGGTLVWVDGRGLPARALARAVLRAAAEAGVLEARVGVAAVPAAAEVAARWGAAPGSGTPEGAARPCTAVAPGAEARFLAAHPLGVLPADPAAVGGAAARRAAAALADAGVTTCGALAALTAAAVEVRFGAAGAALWRLARGEDRRVVFRHAARERPSASVAWTEFELRDPGPLVFAANALVRQLCGALAARGEAARVLALTFALAGGGAVVRPVRGARDTADPVAWGRLVRAALERVGAEDALPDGVVGLALAVEVARAAEAPQADLFDRGAGSAAAAERAAARLVEGEWGGVVRPRLSAHAVPERRLGWEPVEVDAAVRGMTASAVPPAPPPPAAPPAPPAPARAGRGGARLALVRPADLARPAVSADPPADPPADGWADALRLRLFPEPRPVAVTTRRLRGHQVPARYRERLAAGARAPRGGQPLVEVLTAAGPDRVVAGHAGGPPLARDYWQCLTDGGALVLLYREGPAPDPEPNETPDAAPARAAAGGGWFLHGWWD